MYNVICLTSLFSVLKSNTATPAYKDIFHVERIYIETDNRSVASTGTLRVSPFTL